MIQRIQRRFEGLAGGTVVKMRGQVETAVHYQSWSLGNERMMTLVRSQARCKGAKEEVKVKEEEE